MRTVHIDSYALRFLAEFENLCRKSKKTWLLKKRTFPKLRNPSQQSRHKKFTQKQDFQTRQKSCREIETQAKVFQAKFFEVQFATPSQGTRLRGFWGRPWRSLTENSMLLIGEKKEVGYFSSNCQRASSRRHEAARRQLMEPCAIVPWEGTRHS